MPQDRRTVVPGRYTSDDLDRLATAHRQAVADEARRESLDQDREPDCEHGLAAWLCAGPMHYPEGM